MNDFYDFFLDYSSNNVYDRSGSNTPSIVNAQKQGPAKNPPMFITVSLKVIYCLKF